MLIPIVMTWAVAAAPAQDAGEVRNEPLDHRVQTLGDEYEAAVDAHRAALKAAADLTERRVLRKRHPAREFLPRFEALAEEGGGRAWMWIVRECRSAGVERKELGPLKDRCFTRLCAEHTGAEWFGEVLERLRREERAVGPERVRELLRGVYADGAVPRSRAAALYHLARLELDEKDEQSEARAFALLDRLIEQFPETTHAEQAERDLFQSRYLAIGKTPPDFETTDVDGVAFRLSDYRGKVVVIDFWGFW
ncbi:MAG: redoxin domain-containing protein [Planctomycetota bacterium]|jgi:hypothetical protein|nr:redoxin domain-containing protein [Planctomycetota bacterium]